MSRAQNPVVGALLGLGAFGLYAAYDISMKFLGGGYSAIQILFFSGLMALPLTLAYAMADPVQGTLRPARPGLMALPLTLAYALADPVLGTLRPARPGLMAVRVVIVVFNGIVGAYAFANLPLAQCYAIFFTMPIFIALLAVPVLGERIDLPRGLAVILGLVGVVIALDPGDEPLRIAHLSALLGAVSGAMNYVLLRKSGAVERTSVLMLYPMLAQLLVVAALLPLVYRPMPLADLVVTGFMGVVLVAGSLLIIGAYRRARAIIVAPMQYSQILWATIFGALLFGERPSAATALGMAMIILSGLVIVARRDPAP